MKHPVSLAVAALLVGAQAAPAQMDHSGHGGTPPAQLGRVEFSTSCNAAAQQSIQRGVALLHSFWYEEAVATFRRAAGADAGCAMAQWGLATSYLHPLWA